MSRLNNLMDIHLGLLTSESVKTSTSMPNILNGFKRVVVNRSVGMNGYKKCLNCSAYQLKKGVNWCYHYNKPTSNANIPRYCTGTK